MQAVPASTRQGNGLALLCFPNRPQRGLGLSSLPSLSISTCFLIPSGRAARSCGLPGRSMVRYRWTDTTNTRFWTCGASMWSAGKRVRLDRRVTLALLVMVVCLAGRRCNTVVRTPALGYYPSSTTRATFSARPPPCPLRLTILLFAPSTGDTSETWNVWFCDGSVSRLTRHILLTLCLPLRAAGIR